MNHKFLLFIDKNFDIYIPPPYWNVTNFRQSLGHKINHSFKFTNAKFGQAYHPRFGFLIRTIVAISNIRKGQELFVNYGYTLGSSVPEWYSALYKKEMGKNWYKPREQNQCQQRQTTAKRQQQNKCGQGK